MRRVITWSLLLALLAAVPMDAQVRRTRRGRRVKVTIRPGFPIARPLPTVYIRTPRVTVRMTPMVYLPPLEFAAGVVTVPEVQVWHDEEAVDRVDGWTELTLTADDRGSRLLLGVNGRADVVFAEVVFDNGDAQVIDFGDKTYETGTYALLNFRDDRKVDHVRVVARAVSETATISAHLLT